MGLPPYSKAVSIRIPWDIPVFKHKGFVDRQQVRRTLPHEKVFLAFDAGQMGVYEAAMGNNNAGKTAICQHAERQHAHVVFLGCPKAFAIGVVSENQISHSAAAKSSCIPSFSSFTKQLQPTTHDPDPHAPSNHLQTAKHPHSPKPSSPQAPSLLSANAGVMSREPI